MSISYYKLNLLDIVQDLIRIPHGNTRLNKLKNKLNFYLLDNKYIYIINIYIL